MATSRGGPAVQQFMAQVPKKLQAGVLRGAARAGAAVVAEEAKERVKSDDTRADITIKATNDGSRAVAKVSVKPGWGRSVGIWLEYGTASHVISVHSQTRSGALVPRATDKKSLVIDGRYVGKTVSHPGARPEPFLRVSLDAKAADAVTAAQRYIGARVTRAGIVTDNEPGDEA